MAQVSPSKIPIEDWVKAVKKLDAGPLKDEEKKIFEKIKLNKNIPKTQVKFVNFCLHNLKVKDEKVINRVWGHVSKAKAGMQPTEKQTKDTKKAKLTEKHEPKKVASKEKVTPTKPQPAKVEQNKKGKNKNNKDDSQNSTPAKAEAIKKNEKNSSVKKETEKQGKKVQIVEPNKGKKENGVAKQNGKQAFEPKKNVLPIQKKGAPAKQPVKGTPAKPGKNLAKQVPKKGKKQEVDDDDDEDIDFDDEFMSDDGSDLEFDDDSEMDEDDEDEEGGEDDDDDDDDDDLDMDEDDDDEDGDEDDDDDE